MSKKQLYIIVGIFAIITIGFFLASFILTRGGNNTPKETGQEPNGFFPFGNSDSTKVNPNGTSPSGNVINNNSDIPAYVGNKDLPILRQVTKNAVAGSYATQKSGKEYVNYVEKETGNVFETRLEDMQTNRISHSIMPRIYEAQFANSGRSVVMRYLKSKGETISTFVLDIPRAGALSSDNATTSASVPNGRFLPPDIADLKVSADEKTAFYLTRTGEFSNRNSFGSIFNFEKNSGSQVFQSPFSEWLPVAVNSKNVLLQTKASQNVPGFLYSFDIKSGVLKKILGDKKGLTTLPSTDGQRILYSESTKGGLTLGIHNISNNTTVNLILQTLPEKCAWKSDSLTIYCAAPQNLPGTAYPDAWYQGTVSFSDNLWQVDANTGKSVVILVPSSFTVELMDMTSLVISPLQDFIYFTNKKDSSLWAFEVHKAEA
ncbi:MAG: hypothetical protein WCT49_00160 [Candidatus Paceibacterota bacterium]|jgi:hypothetical protein|nr:hypothetical protein [Candidatus Paceibacterota bacterium]